MCLLMADNLLVHLNPTFQFLAFGSRKLFFGCPGMRKARIGSCQDEPRNPFHLWTGMSNITYFLHIKKQNFVIPDAKMVSNFCNFA